MHEMVYVHKALDIVLETCGDAVVESVHLAIGEATDIIPEYIEDMFRFLARDTVAENARLVIRRIPFVVQCNKCASHFSLDVHDRETWKCPDCGARQNYHLVSGREFMIEHIEIRQNPSAKQSNAA